MRKAYFFFFVFGTLSVGTQTLLIRTLVSVFSGSEIVIGFSLGVWLIGTATGGILSRKIVPLKQHKTAFSTLSSILFLAIPASTFIALITKRLLGLTPFEMASPSSILISSLLSTFLPSLVFGIVFAISVDYIKSNQKAPIRTVYLWESIGSFLGGGLLSVLIIPFINHLSGSLILSSLSLMPLFILCSNLMRVFICIISFLFILFGTIFSSRFGLIIENLKTGEKILRYITGYNGDYSLMKKGNTYYILLNNSPILNYPEYKTREANVYIPLGYNKKNVLIIGGTLSIEQKIAPKNWHILIYPSFIMDMEKTILGSEKNLHNIINEEPLIFLRKSRTRYDAIVVYHSDPYTGGDNRFFTQEFFWNIKKHLKENGILIFSAGEPSNYINIEQADYLASLLKTAEYVFPFVKVFPLDRFYFLCSEKELSFEPLWEKALGRYVRKEYTVWDASPERIDYYMSNIKKRTNKVKSNSILMPSSYLYFLKFHMAKTGDFFAVFINTLDRIHPEFIIPLLLLIIVLIPSHSFSRNAVPLTGGFIVGYIGLFCETSLMLLYQMIYGYLYFFIGLFITFFMGGLSFGAKGRIQGKKGFLISSIGITSVCLISVIIFLKRALLSTNIVWGTLIFSTLQFTFGFLSGRLFKECSAMLTGEQPKMAGIIDAIDHIGGALSAILSPFFFIPVLGFTKAMLSISIIPMVPLIGLIIWDRKV